MRRSLGDEDDFHATVAGAVLGPVVRYQRFGIGATLGGQEFKEGDKLVTLEAMKMYTAINALSSGTITAIHVKVGEAVEENQALYTIG